ncbi:MAG: hypothetical protein HOI92_09955 [Alphaproteobacteria bacterium]|jgi:hypothetical protein|nr:hypothetical protein [Alphaproteobacteria bacterium]MDG2466324.1 hypothetical protein [Alphaproteobacteria bacterium]
MSKPRDIFQRLALREKMTVMARAETIRTLDDEHQKISNIGEKLTQMADETQPNPGITSMMSLRSAQHYSSKIHEQLKVIEQRKGFLEEEISEERLTLGTALSRQNRAEEKSRQYRQNKKEEHQEKAANDVPRPNTRPNN